MTPDPLLSVPDSGMSESGEEDEEAMSDEAFVYELSVMLMRLDGNGGDPHQLLWCGGTMPEPWGDAWQRYEEQARKLFDVLGENMAWALLHEWPPQDSPAPSTAQPSSQNGCPCCSARITELEGVLRELLALEVAKTAFGYLDKGIGTATPNKAWLAARAALKEPKQ